MKKKFLLYDNKETLVVISPYPKKGEVYSAGRTGVASYTKNLVSKMQRKVVVLADKNGYPKDYSYNEKNTRVIRAFRRSSLAMWFDLWRQVKSFGYAKNVHIQYDFAMYGGVLVSALVIPFLLLLRIFGYKTSITLHHVVDNVDKLSGHLGLRGGSRDWLKCRMYNVAFRTFYRLLGLVCEKVIVPEETLKDRLAALVSSDKVYAVPHGVDVDVKRWDKGVARKKLGIGKDEHMVMFFGYVNWFKGADFFACTFARRKKIGGKYARFVIAGGESPTLKDRAYYKEYFSKVQKSVDGSSSVNITGYVEQKDIAVYFAACDLLILPYRYYMTASGVLSLALSYKTPFLVSSELSALLKAPDFENALSKAGLKREELVFGLSDKACIRKTEEVLKDHVRERVVLLAEHMRKVRAYKEMAKLYEQIIFAGMPAYRLAATYAYATVSNK